ncbi:MAG: 23S rRNA (guanosine(2251)-2'-O)-methyltransferase RlmB [Bellilinea sp.]|jgi:23S rRNA (guanosine2251-2'-O)-methyltransferase
MREWITGRNPVYEVFQARRRQVFRLLVAAGTEDKGRLAEILALAAKKRIPLERVQRQRLDSLGENHQGVAAEVSAYPYADFADILSLTKQRQELPLVLVLDMLQNPQNLGTLLRSAEAAGVHGAIIPPRRAAGITPAVVHASAGASEHLRVTPMNLAQAMDRLKAEGIWVVGLEGEASQSIEEAPLDAPLALVIGNEGEGMRSLVSRKCDLLVNLPMRGKINSLNAAVAGSIALYLAAIARRRKAANASP